MSKIIRTSCANFSPPPLPPGALGRGTQVVQRITVAWQYGMASGFLLCLSFKHS